MHRHIPDVWNYESQMLPFLHRWQDYKEGFIEMLTKFPAQFYAVANFHSWSIEPEECRKRFNLFDLKLGRSLLGRHCSKKPASERPQWLAVPERARFLHYNVLFDVPIELHERFWYEAPRIWKKVVPAGQLHIQVIGDTDKDRYGVRNYSVKKAFHPDWSIENLISSAELRRN
jgi:hypothetical protein